MATFESLRPREATLFPDPYEDPEDAAFSAITPAGTSVTERARRPGLVPRDTVDRPVVSNVDGDESPAYAGPEAGTPVDATVGRRDDGRDDSLALQNQGVNWTDKSDVGSRDPRLRAASTDFYETDYDPEGKVSRALGQSRNYVEAANVFGRQFSRDELMRDDEGQRLVHLMEVQRSGAHRDEGFWSGFATFKDTSGSYKRALADIPFLGWMVDGGFTVGETIEVSKAMRKMQNGEPVTNHEALAVRRYMLQSELDEERGIGYKAGEVFHSSIPFAIEMATAGYLTAKATAIGASVGGPWGAAIGLIGGLIFGGVGVAWKMFARRGVKGAMKKGVEATAKQTMASIAKAEFGKDVITSGARSTLRRTVLEHAGGAEAAKVAFAEAKDVGRNTVFLKWGRAAAVERLGEAQAKTMPAEALIEMGKAEAKKRSGMAFAKEASFEANKYLASRYSRVVKPDMSARAARVFLVGGDQERSFHYGLMEALETATLAKNGQAQTGEVVLKYGAKKKLLRQLTKEGKGLTEAEADDVVKKYIEGTLKAGSVSDSKSLSEAAKAVVESMEASLGGDTVNHGYAREVLDYLGKSARHSFELKYGATTTRQLFVNDMRRFGGFLADGILDGAFRWDQSIFGGLGTIARDGTALHGKMNVLKEAMKVSMIEAPVRGALQMAVGAPLWPAAAALSGHSPGDFVLKGQLGIQATALRTGDKDLMDNARAIALGAGLVEYMSENAGRGFNMFMSGIVKPSVMNVLPEQTKQLGSALAKKVEAIFGSNAAMKKENFEAIAGKIESRLGAEVSAGKLTGSVSRAEIMRLVETGKASANLETIARQLGMKPKKLVSEAVAEVVTDGKARTAALSMFSYEMMRRGWTPQKMVDVLQKVGYDGILSEMAEERYGGFLQGLFGLNERPSDEGFRGRLAAAWEGLFPDKEQLAVEAIGFAIPSVSHLSLSHLQSRLGQGMLSKIRQASQGLNIIKGSVPDVSISGVSAKYVNARREHQEKVDEAVRTRFGTDEGNRAKALGGAAAAFAKVRAANEAEARKEAPPPDAPKKTESNQHLFGIDSEREFSLELGRVMDAIVEQSGTEEELDANIDRYDAKALFGEDGVEAIRNMKRLDGDFVDQAKRDFDASPEMQALYDATPRSEDYAEPMSVEDVINRVEMTVPVRGEDMSPIAGAAGREGADTTIRANQYGQDVLGETAANLAILGNASFNLQNNRATLPENASFKERVVDGGLRVLSRLCSVVDAIVTGDLSLAARNPIQWALADESVDKSLLGTVGMMKQRSFRMGMAQVLSEERNNLAELDENLANEVRPLLEEIDEAVAKAGAAKNDPAARKAAYDRKDAAEKKLEERLAAYATSIGKMQTDKMGEDMKRRFEAAGEESYQRMLRDYASRFLAARNVLAVSQSDLSDAALSVVADRFARRQGAESLFMYRRDDGSVATTTNFLSPEFREAHAEDIERAKHEIIDKLVDLATGDAIKLNTNARFSVTESTAAAIDYKRAMRQGATPEILAAIKGMPAFASSRVVVDLSLGNATRDALGALGSVADVSELLNMQLDENGDLAPGDLMRVMRLRGRNFVYASPEQNQRDAKRFLRQVRVLADNMLPYVCLDAQGNRLDVTYERGVDGKTNVPFARATVWMRDESGRPVASSTYAAGSMIELVYALKAAGLQAKMRQLVIADSFSLASRDATSMLLYRFGDRDNARAFYLKQGADEAHMPPLCRRKYDKATQTEDWEFTEDGAVEQLRQEIELASMPNAPAGREEDYENARGAVYGSEGTEDAPAIPGYETTAADYLRSLGMSPVMNTVEENLIVGAGEKWVFAPNSMTRGDSMFITSDYNSSGDSEAMLRATLESAFLNHAVREHHAGRTGFTDTLRAISREFDTAAAMIIGELEPTKPEWAQRIRTLQEALSGPGGDANPRKLAAIAAAALCFTSERGLGERGNGFLFSPELAAVADQLRTSEWFTLLISAADEALGGVGLFSEAPDLAGAKVQELIDAFSPTGEAVAQSRKTSIFNRTGEEGAEKPSVPYSVMKYEGSTLGKNGMTAHASFELRSFGELQNLNNVRPDTVLSEIADAANEFAVRFRKDVGRPMTLDDAVLLTQAAVGAGNADESVRPEVRRKKAAPVAPAFGGARAVSASASEAVRPRTDDIISQVAAVKLARGLAFLEPSEEVRKKAMVGKLTEIEANKYAEIRSEDVQDDAEEGAVRTTLYDEVDAFLRSRRVDALSRKVILENLAIGLGEPIESVDEQGQDDEGDPDEAEAATDEGRLNPFQDKLKAESAVKNKDLQEIGAILQYLFPVQMRNHTDLFYHVATEIGDLPAWLRDMAQSEEAPAWMKEALADKELMTALERLGSALNVLRKPGEADPEGRVAASFDWGDATAADKLLSDAVLALSIVKRDDLALAVNMLRLLGRGRRGATRRAKALSDIASMCQLDAEVTRVQMTDKGALLVESERAGHGEVGAEPVQAAILAEFVSGAPFTARGSLWGGLKDIKARLINSGVEPNGGRKYDERTKKEVSLADDEVSLPEFDEATGSFHAKKVDEKNEDVVAIANWLASDEFRFADRIPLSVHASIVAFARKFVKGLRDASDTLTGWIDHHTELQTLVRVRGLEGAIIRDVEATINAALAEPSSDRVAGSVFDRLCDKAFYLYRETGSRLQTYEKERYNKWTRQNETYLVYVEHVCPILETLVLNPAWAAASYGYIPMDEKDLNAGTQMIISIEDFDEVLDDDLGLVRSASRTNVKSAVVTADNLTRSNAFQETKVLGSFDTAAIASLARWYADAAPRRTAQVSVRTNAQFQDSGRAVQTPSTAPLAEYRLAASLFGQVKRGDGTWMDSYSANGRMFDDGTMATVVTPGVEIGDRLAEGSSVARYVFEANVRSFVKDRDFRNVRFQLYHGEKPTVYSQQLPGEMVDQMWKDLVAGAKYTLNKYTKDQTRADRLRTMPASLEELKTEDDRRFAYNMLFAVVAAHAGCDQIDPKRTQVLMSQGVMYAGHRDFAMVEGADGELHEERLDNQIGKDGKPVVPMTRFIVSLAEFMSDGAPDLGMYCITGNLVEMQRATATNHDAESFKNHLNAIAGVFLTKGQGHDLKMGLYEDEDVPALGTLLAAQAAMRREAERLLGLEKGILDLPDETRAKDAAYVAKRDAAVAAVEFFLRHSTFVHTDLETQKVGLFAARNGVEVVNGEFTIGEGEPAVRFRRDGQTISYEKDGARVKVEGLPVGSMKKDGPVPVAVAVAAYMSAIGKSELSDEDCAALKARWVTAAGVVEAALGESGLLMKGDVLSFGKDSLGNFQARFGSRHIVGQVMANNDASADMGHHSRAATNYTRDQAANQGARPHEGELTVSRILTVARALPAALFRTEKGLADAYLESDEQFAMRRAENPWDDTVRAQEDRKLNAHRANAMRVYPTATHAVLLGSGIKADIDRTTHKVKGYSYAAGVTDYDKDAVRDARILPTQVAKAYGVDRTIPSGLVNVVNDPSFRYGWHLDDLEFERNKAALERLVMVAGTQTEAKWEEYKATLKDAHGEGAQDTEAVALIAAAIWAAHHIGGDRKAAVMKLFGEMFTDYTGRKLSDHLKPEQLEAVSFHDLFLHNDGVGEGNDFDFTAIEFGERGRKLASRDAGAPRTIYLGGSLFSGDRRPSGNFEAASGLSRAQLPVKFNKKTGVPSDRAQFVLSPVLNAVQGSDTDGDSATLIRFSGRGATKLAHDAVDAVFKYLDGVRRARSGTLRAGKSSDSEAKGVVEVLRGNPRYERFLRVVPVRRDGKPVKDGYGNPVTRTVLSEEFTEALGDLLFEVQINNYRRTPTVEQGGEDGRPPRSGSELANADPDIMDIGFSGRDPVGPDAVFDSPVEDGGALTLYREVMGDGAPMPKNYSKAFKACIDKLTEGRVPSFDILDAEVAAYLSGEAADASDARATAVSLQASIEHIAAYSHDDERMQSLYPHLYAPSTDGYSPLKELVAHLDGISNALFDVVKDLFAPRAGWRDSMLNYLVARLLSDAEEGLKSGNVKRLDDAWFFKELVSYARDFHSSELSIPGLLRRASADNNFMDEDAFGATRPEKTLRGCMKAALAPGEGHDTILSWLARNVVVPSDKDGEQVPFSSIVKADVFDSGDMDFVDSAKGWVDRMLGAAATMGNVFRLANSLKSAPEALRRAVLGDGGTTDTEAVVAFVTRVSGISKATYKETSFALLSHALFSETAVADKAVARADAALDSILSLERLRGVEAAMSPEPAFRAGGQRAASAYRKTELATNEDGTFVHVSPENSDYLTARFVTQDLLAGITNEQFDPTRLAGEIKDGDKDLQQDISGRAMPASYQAWCERRGVTPLDVSDRGEFDRYIGALSLKRYTAPGTVDANRRRLGRIIGVLRHGLTLMEEEHHHRDGDKYIAPGTEKEAARARLEALMRDVWPMLLTPDRKTGESILGNAICDAIVLGPTTVKRSDAGRIVSPEAFLAALRIVKDWSLAEETEDGGLRLPARGLALASKMSVDQADRLRGAFNAMLEDMTGDFTYRHGADADARRKAEPEPIPLMYEVTSKVDDKGNAAAKETMEDTVSPTDMAFLIELAVVAGRPFSSVTESDTRVDLTCIFDRKTLSDQECWGVAAEKTMVGRALCCLGGSAESMYDIVKDPLEYPTFAVQTAVPLYSVLASTEPEDKTKANVFKGSRYSSKDAWNQLDTMPMTPIDILIDATMPGAEIERRHADLVKDHMSSRQSLAAIGVLPALVDGKEQRFENRLVSSFDVKRGPDVLTGLNEAPKNAAGEYTFKFVGGEQYDPDDGEPIGPSLHTTLEDAVNSLGAGGSFVRGSGSFEQDVAEWVMRRKKGDMSFRELAKSVLRRTRERYGDAVDVWAERALDRGGRTTIDPATFGPVRAGVADYRTESAVRREGEQREYDKTNPLGDAFDSEFPLGPEMAAQREADEQVRPSVVIGFEESNIEKRMSRSGFAQFLQDADKDVKARVLKEPIRNIRNALEAVFGASDGNGKVGVKVERVTETGKAGKISTNLIKVTRWYKVEENGSVEVKSAVTYIATGEVLGMHPDNNAYLAGIARAVSNGDAEAEARTLELLKGMKPEQVAAFARAQGCSVAGESDTGLTTTKLLALTGLIRLGSGADYKTLFHEYFHQMLAFYRRIGVCTAKDMEELTAKFNVGGQFNEEAAADAFAEYVVGKTDGPEPGKLLADGVGDDQLFNRFLKTAQAFLAGATAVDADGAPVFMKMLVTGDFSERSVRKAAEATNAELARVERMLLGQDVDLPAGLNWQGPRGITVIESDVTLAYAAFRDGKGGQKEFFDALRAYMNGSADAKEHPEFKPTDKPFAIDPEAAEEGKPLEPKKEKKSKKGKKGKKLDPKKAKPEKSGCVRAAEMMRAALNGLENGVLPPDAQRAYDALKSGDVHDTAAASDCLVIAAELMHSLQYAYGLAEKDIVGDKDKILELAVRIAHMAAKATPAEAGEKYACHKLLASQDALAKVLRGVAPSKQHGAVMASVEAAASYLETVAGHIATPENAEAVRRMAAEVRRTGAALASGKTLGLTFGTLLGFALDGVSFHQGPDGLVVELAPTKSSIHDAAVVREIEQELRLAAHALGLAYAFGELLRENGKDRPAAGASPELGRNPARPPANGCLEPDVSPQMILQSQTSWLASDMMRKFFGVDLRDIMTDTSYQAATERSNLDMRNLEFYYGADVQPGGRARAVSLGTVDLRMSKDGVMEANRKFRRDARQYAAVRGHALGLVNRAAKEAGDAWEWNDVDLVNLALQTAGYIANGERHYITGIDLSNDTHNQLKDLFAKRLTKTPEGYDGSFDPRAVIDRVHGKRKGEAVATERPLNLDQALYKVITCLNPAVTGVELDDKGRPTGKVAKDGLYDVIVDTYARVLGAVASRSVPAGFRIDVKVAEQLANRGYAMTVKSGTRAGKSYLTIPVEKIEEAWDGSDTVKKLVKAGRTKSLLSLRRAAQEIATAAARLNRAASRSTFVREASGRVITGQGLAGMWFDAGSGGHGLSVRAFENARDFFDTPVSNADEDFLRNKFRAFALTAQSDAKKTWRSGIRSMVTGAVGGTTVRGLEPAFMTDRDGNLVHVQVNKIQHLMQLMGFNARASHNEILAFVEGVHEGIYARGSARNPSSVDLNGGMTVFQLDHAIYELECVELHRAMMNEGDSVLTRPESEGGYGYSRQDLVDLNEWLRREGLRMMLDEEADRKVDNAVNTVSAATMLQEFGELPSSRTGTERVKAMAETLATSERFRGCLAQMLTTVGVDGSPNYVVSPGAGAENFAPDQYWGALARFVLAKMAVFHGNRGFGYDDTLSGVENMRRVAERVRAEAARDDNMKKKPGTRIPWRLVPPDDIQAGNLFGFVLAREDDPEGNEDKMNAFVGGEAMGYMKQLFGVVKSPTTWRGWATLDRIMAYSKAMSVGMSAFFAFATRFESPVAACGFLNTVAGYRKWSSNLARKLGEKLRRDKDGKVKTEGVGAAVADFFNLEENMPYLKDFIEANTSDDPSIAYMREYMDLAGMPLSDAIRNPMSDTGGQIDSDIKRLSDWLIATGHKGLAKEVRGLMNAALHNPGEYAFSNVLNCVKMAVVAQTLHRLRRECERAQRPFDPVRELRRFSAYINAEIGGIQPERYAWLTPGMQQVLRLAMFSYQWTMGAWTAGTGGVVTDMIFGGHSTTKDTRRFAFIRWLRMLGIVKVGVPVCMQLMIKGLAKALSGAFIDPDDPDGEDPLGIEDMPWLCFDNESKIGALSFDITPLLRLCGKIRGKVDDATDSVVAKGVSSAVPIIVGLAGGLMTRSVGGGLITATAAKYAGSLLPDYTGVGHGRNTSGQRRYYMHFGKQSDEFWRWFTDFWSQATNKLSVPTQKTVEAFFGSTNGSNFGKNFKDKPILDRFFTTSLDPQDNALVNWFTSFMPFSAASVASNPDAGVLGMFAPIQMGASMTGQQKRIAARLEKFALDERFDDPWADPRNRKDLRLLTADILRECRLNGFQPEEVLKSGLGTATGNLYKRLYSALPKTKDDKVDGAVLTETLRAMRRLQVKKQSVDASLKKKFKAANVDLESPRYAHVSAAIRTLFKDTARDPWMDDAELEATMQKFFDEGARKKLRSTDVQQDRKGGEAFSNFLATDEVPETLFGIPVVSSEYRPEDLEFFRRNPKAAGYYDLGDGGEEPPPEEPPPEGPPPEEPPVQAANKAGDASEKAVPSKTRSESEAVQALYEGVAPSAVEALRARTIRARGGDPDKVTLGEIATTGTPVVRDGFDPEPYGSYKVEYRPDERRSVAMTARGVAKIADHTAQREELTHLLDPGGAEPVPQGWTRKPGESLGDLYQRRAQSVNRDAADSYANYYVYGRRSEREMAMSILKQAIGRNFAAAGGDPVERTSGTAILGMLSDYADHRLAPGDDLPFIEEAKGDGYSFHRLKADDKASMPGKKVLQEYIRLYKKTKDGEPLNEVEREAWEQLSNPDAWDRVVSADRFGKAVRAAEGGGTAAETFDTPIPKELQAKYDAWYAQLPKNLQYTGDYDLQGTWLERLGQPDKYEASQNGHLDDYGKKPNHITFSTGSKWHDPKVPERAGGEWKQAEDGSWDFYPGTGNKASDDELKAYFDKYERGNRVHKRETREANGADKAKKKIPPIVKGPLHYGPPPPPPRGPYPGIANNPGNVEKHERRADKTLFKGEIADGVRPKRFANFSDPVDGLTAAATVLSRRAAGLAAKGLPFTIENYVPGYAPKSENDVDGYINNLSKYSGFARDAVLDTGNAEDMAKLLKNVVRFESGVPNSEWFTDDEYRRAALAMQEGASGR